MTAPVTNQSYTQQVNQAFDMLKYATPQQMQLVTQQVQQNPNSPEAIALAMASQYQQQARAPQPQAPQGTILEQKLAQFKQASPQGLPQVGQNQMNLQQAAQQDPMRNAGIGAAPENTEPQPEAQEPQQEQTAATGGIVALAGGGQVEHFANGGGLGSIHPTYSMSTPEDMSAANQGLGYLGGFAKSDEYDLGSEDYDVEPIKTKIARLDPVETPANPNSSAAKEAASPTAKESIAMYRELLGSEADLSEEVSMAKDMAKEAGRDKGINAMIQGIGGMLSARTPYTSQAVGAGLLAGASGYAQGATEERSAQKDLMALQAAHKKALVSGDREAATMYLNNMAKQQEAIALAKAKREDRADEQRTKYGVAGIEGEYGLKKQEISNNAALVLENLKASNSQDLKILEDELAATGNIAYDTRQKVLTSVMSGLTANGDSPDAATVEAALDQAIQYMKAGQQGANIPKTNYGAPISKIGTRLTPPPTQ
jgi:hypothetical protein